MASEFSFVSDMNTTTAVKPSVSSSLKRKGPPGIEIPSVLQEIQTDRSTSRDPAPQDDAVCLGEIGVWVSSVKGKKKFMEDTHKILPCLQGKSNKVSYWVLFIFRFFLYVFLYRYFFFGFFFYAV
jgi:protein phosphatase 1L